SENVIVRGVIWQLHSGDDNAHIRVARFHLVDDLLEIISNFCNRHAAKGVVNPELENKDVDPPLATTVGVAFKTPRQSLHSAGCCSTALAGVCDFEIQIRGPQLFD